MKLAYNQASRALGNTGDNPAVGCVIVKNDELISLAHTNFNGRPHAERIALSNKKISFKGSLLYSTLEPCSHYGKTSPCTDIIKKKNIKTVYFSKFDPDKRSFKKAKRKLNKYNIKTFENVHKYAGDSFYKDFDIKKRTNNIFISSKLATSKDLFISHKYNKWITNIYSRGRVHLLRANHDSILTTSKTILKDNAKYFRIVVLGGGCAGFQYKFEFDNSKKEHDIIIETSKVNVLIDDISLKLIKGSKIDYVNELIGSSFKISNPQASSSCGCGTSFSV